MPQVVLLCHKQNSAYNTFIEPFISSVIGARTARTSKLCMPLQNNFINLSFDKAFPALACISAWYYLHYYVWWQPLEAFYLQRSGNLIVRIRVSLLAPQVSQSLLPAVNYSKGLFIRPRSRRTLRRSRKAGNTPNHFVSRCSNFFRQCKSWTRSRTQRFSASPIATCRQYKS